LTGDITVADVGLVSEGRQNRPLQSNQRGIGSLKTTVHLLIVIEFLLVIVDSKSGRDLQPIGQSKLNLSEGSRARIPKIEIDILSVAVKESGSRDIRARGQKKSRGRRSLFRSFQRALSLTL
jgi:hypothetical protein